jgi:beta-glucanase (GH16 family)
MNKHRLAAYVLISACLQLIATQRIDQDFLLNFNSPTDLSYFIQDTGNDLSAANEKQIYTQINAEIRSGFLNIVTERDTDKYTSARLISKASFRYGLIELKAKLPKGTGILSCFKLVPTIKSNNVYTNGEIAVMKYDGYEPVG